MKVNVVSRKLIKPCIPTPQNINKHKLSFMDEQMPPANIGVILLYPISNPEKRSHLEESLAKILPQFYPLAGRYIKNQQLVDCSYQGAEFVEAEAVGEAELVTDLVAKMEYSDQISDLLPRQCHQVDNESPTNPLLSIQITEFKKCGGLAIGISISHKIFDSSSVGTFIAAWSKANIINHPNPGPEMICPSFDAPDLFPRKINEGHYTGPDFQLPGAFDHHQHISNTLVKRFSFNKEAIASLRSRLSPNNDDYSIIISRVRVVCAVIAKALIAVDRRKHGGRSRACILAQAVNMRGRTVTPLPKHSCGNLVVLSTTRCITATETEKIGFQELVDLLRDGVGKTVADCAEVFSPYGDVHGIIMDPVANFMEKSMSGEVNALMFSDWSKFGFCEADLVGGKPVGTGVGKVIGENIVTLMDNKEGGGMDAWVHLDRIDMTYFEQDDEINKLFTR